MRKFVQICLTFCVAQSLFSQEVAKCKAPQCAAGSNVIIKSATEKNGDIQVTLVNCTSDTLVVFGGYSGKIRFNKEIQDNSGSWKPYDQESKYAYWCGTGLRSLTIPSNYCTQESYEQSRFKGSFKTKIRFSFVLDQKVVYSNPQTAMVNKKLLLTPEDRSINALKKDLKTPERLTKQQKDNYVNRVVLHRFSKGDHRQAYEDLRNYKSLLAPGEFRALELALLSKYVGAAKNLSRLERALLASKIIAVCERLIEVNYPRKKRVQQYRKFYTQHLLTAEEFQRMNPTSALYQLVVLKESRLTNTEVVLRFKAK